MRRLPPHGKEKCGSPRVTLRLHQLKEKKKDKLSTITGDHHDSYNCRGMDVVSKNGNGTVDDGSGGKETSGNNCDENGTGGTTGEHKENGVNSGTTGSIAGGNAPAGDGEHHHHHHGNDRLDTSSTAGGAPVKRSHSTDEDDDSKKKRRKDDGNRGKSGSNSGGSPKSLIGVESEGEDVKSVESPGPKVPPLKIVIAGASLEEPGPGGRNGKNGSGRHHLPYVVSTTATTTTNSSNAGGGATTPNSSNNNNSNNNNNSSSASSADTINSNISASESQSGIAEEPVGPRSPTDEPVTSPSGGGGTITGRGHQRVLRSHRITKVTDVCRSGGGGAGKEERTGSGGSNNGGSGHSSPAGITTADSGSPRGLEGTSPSPGVEGANTTGSCTNESSTVDDKGINGSSANSNNNSGTVSTDARVSGNNTTASDESPATNGGTQTNSTTGQVQSTVAVQQSPSTLPSQQTELHPRKRKMRPKENLNNSNNNSNNNGNNNSTSNTVVASGNGGTSPTPTTATTTTPPTTTTTTTISTLPNNTGQSSPNSSIGGGGGGSCTVNGGTGVTQNIAQQNGNGTVLGGQTETNTGLESAGPSSTLQHHDQAVTNSYQLFLNIRKQIERKRKGLFPVQPKPPQGFKDYLMNRCTYVLASNATNRVPPPNTNPPPNLHQGIKDLYIAQEKERHRLLMQHVIEKEKLVLSVEQEILRVHGRAARALANQALPFSACTILRDEEVYSAISPEQEEKDRNQARSRYNGRLFLSWLQDVDDKWEKIKESMLVRHHNEAESLHAVQKMDWEWKMKELGICEMKSNPVIDESHVPMVHVSDDFDLLPA